MRLLSLPKAPQARAVSRHHRRNRRRPSPLLPVLASLELAGAGGILLGLWLEPLGGVAVAAALVAYFVGAVAGHPRVRDTKGLIMPLLPLVFSIAVLALRLATL